MENMNIPADSSKQESIGGRVPECVYPGYVSCRGCEHSYRPDLFDGGCRLHYERDAGKGGA